MHSEFQLCPFKSKHISNILDEDLLEKNDVIITAILYRAFTNGYRKGCYVLCLRFLSDIFEQDSSECRGKFHSLFLLLSFRLP